MAVSPHAHQRLRQLGRGQYTQPPSEEMLRLIEFLTTQTWSGFAQSLVKQYKENGRLSAKQMHSAKKMFETARIKEMIANSGHPKEELDKKLPLGVYYQPDTKTVWRLREFENNYGKMEQVCRIRKEDVMRWRDAPNGVYELKMLVLEKKASLLQKEDAAALGRSTGLCCVCGVVLDNPKSIAAGIGPDCAKRFEANGLDKSS